MLIAQFAVNQGFIVSGTLSVFASVEGVPFRFPTSFQCFVEACEFDTDCDDADECTEDFCNPTTGCIHLPIDQCECPCDLNSDGLVDAFDLAELLGSWGPCEGCPADFNADNAVNAADLAQALGAWGACP